MIGLMDHFQSRAIDVRVALGGADARVTQQFLDDPQICPSFQQMRGKRMAEGVRADRSWDHSRLGVSLQESPDPLPRQSAATAGHEDGLRARLALHEAGTQNLQRADE